MEYVTPLAAFGAGMLSFLSPCVLPLVPVYLATLAGPGVLEQETGRFRLSIFLHSLTFVLGFTIVFSLWGAGIGLLGSFLATYITTIRYIAGGILVAAGLFMLAATRIPWLNYEKRLNLRFGDGTGYLRSLIIGAVFCFAWTPCLGPVIAGISVLAGTASSVWRAAFLLAIYSLGLGIPFLAMGIFFGVLSPLLKKLARYSNWIYVISGLLLIVVGTLILLNRLIWF